jgi:predicted transcriptional regulator
MLERFRRPGIDYADAADRPTRLTKARIEALGAEVAEWLGFSPGDSVLAVAERLHGRISYLSASELSDHDGSIYVHGPHDFDILVPDWTSTSRDKFTVAHELGHYVLHSGVGAVPLVALRLPVDRRGRSEWEANWFAAGFLMPEEAFRRAWDRYGGCVERSALMFGVSLEAAEVRARRLGLLDG